MADDSILTHTGERISATSDGSADAIKVLRVQGYAGVPGSGGAASTGIPALDVARGLVPNVSGVFKYGRATDVDATDTDVWDRANATDAQPIWLAPTAARIHQVTSSDAGDTMSLTYWYLADWDTAEASATITLDGTNNVATASAVIINRMRALGNAGKITATASTDSTVTSQITAAEGQTEQAILGFPSTQTFYLTRMWANVIKGANTVSADIELLACDDPENNPTVFRVADAGSATFGSAYEAPYDPPRPFTGPKILKVRANGSTTNMTVTATFTGYLVTE